MGLALSGATNKFWALVFLTIFYDEVLLHGDGKIIPDNM